MSQTFLDAANKRSRAEEPPTLHYFNIKGRGEPIRMTFAACGATYREVPIDFGEMKANAGTSAVPFGQAPQLELEDGTVLTQMTAVMRFIAASHRPALIGDSILMRANVDMLLNATDDLYLKYISCVYGSSLSNDAKQKLWAQHFDPASKSERNGGAHLAYLVNYLARSDGPFLCGSQFTIADIFFYFVLEAFSREQCFGAKLTETYPALTAYMAKVTEVDGLKARLEDPKRAPLNWNGNGLG